MILVCVCVCVCVCLCVFVKLHITAQPRPVTLVILPPLLPCYSLDYLSWRLLDQPFLFYIFFLFPLKSPPFPTYLASTTILQSLALLRLSSAFSDPILVPVPVILVPVPISATVLASVPVPAPILIRCVVCVCVYLLNCT